MIERGIRCAVGLAAGVLLLYIAFLTKSYYWDGVLFSLNIEEVHGHHAPMFALLHPNHLVYNVFGYWLYSLLLQLHPGIRAIMVLQVVNVLTSVLTGYVVFVIARRVTNDVRVAFACWLLFAAGATWWKFSTDADTYIICVLLISLSAQFLLAVRPLLVPAALCHATAMLFHELAIFTYIPVLAVLLLRRRIWTALCYCAGTGTCVASVYWLCYSHADQTRYPTLLNWVASYASDSSFTHSISDIVAHYLTSYLKLFVGGRFSLVREFFGLVEVAAFVICGLLLFAATRAWKQTAAVPAPDQRAKVFLWAWFIGYALFLAIWDPGSAFHKLFVWPPIVLLIGIYGRAHARSLAFFAGALAAWNFGAFIYPHSHAGADPVLVLSERVNRELPKDAIVFYRVLDPDDWYLEYFAPGRTWRPFVLLDEFPPSRPTCYETTALPEVTLPINPKLKWDLVNNSHNIRLECLARP
jgi:hypothetical protein